MQFFRYISASQNTNLRTVRRALEVVGECEQEHMGVSTFLALGEHTYQLAAIRFALNVDDLANQ
jgi:hypothetical protein